ncbi:MAG: hypothetical protein PHX18_06800 [Candidatus Gastranaerophilales bacterium]|nr:hypothetical protein [Candidatus Gastranaerophilales bacterium]
MKAKYRIIKEVAKISDDSDEIIIFTKAFKAKGKFVTDSTLDDVIALRHVKVVPVGMDFEHDSSPSKDGETSWLNVFADEVVAFSFLK